jgi:hypothetical protein
VRHDDVDLALAGGLLGVISLEHLTATEVERADVDPGIDLVEGLEDRPPVHLANVGVDEDPVLSARGLDDLAVVGRIIVWRGRRATGSGCQGRCRE